MLMRLVRQTSLRIGISFLGCTCYLIQIIHQLTDSISIFPASILQKSRMSLMMPRVVPRPVYWLVGQSSIVDPPSSLALCAGLQQQ